MNSTNDCYYSRGSKSIRVRESLSYNLMGGSCCHDSKSSHLIAYRSCPHCECWSSLLKTRAQPENSGRDSKPPSNSRARNVWGGRSDRPKVRHDDNPSGKSESRNDGVSPYSICALCDRRRSRHGGHNTPGDKGRKPTGNRWWPQSQPAAEPSRRPHNHHKPGHPRHPRNCSHKWHSQHRR